MDAKLTDCIDHNIFKHRAVRDLAWTLLRPSLFSTLPESLYEQAFDVGTLVGTLSLNNDLLSHDWFDQHTYEWLQAIDEQPERLEAHLKDQRATRLGVYFEQLLSFYFSQYPRFTLIAKNLQVNDAKRTIGEYDFIIWDDKDQQHYHVEVAIKFYVGFITPTT